MFMTSSKDKLIKVLVEIEHPDLEAVLVKAQAGAYDDYESMSATPKIDLIEDLVRLDRYDLANRVAHGEFDATPEETLTWLAKGVYPSVVYPGKPGNLDKIKAGAESAIEALNAYLARVDCTLTEVFMIAHNAHVLAILYLETFDTSEIPDIRQAAIATFARAMTTKPRTTDE
jgi:hypothetical protein